MLEKVNLRGIERVSGKQNQRIGFVNGPRQNAENQQRHRGHKCEPRLHDCSTELRGLRQQLAGRNDRIAVRQAGGNPFAARAAAALSCDRDDDTKECECRERLLAYRARNSRIGGSSMRVEEL